MARKPRVTKLDAAMIAIRHVEANGLVVVGAPDVHSPVNDGTWSVFVPDGTNMEPGGAVVIVDQNTGEARLLPTL